MIMGNEVELFKKLLIAFFILEIGIALVAFMVTKNVPSIPAVAGLTGLSNSVSQQTNYSVGHIACIGTFVSNFKASCVLIPITNTDSGFLGINFFFNGILIVLNIIAEIILFIIGFLVVMGIALLTIFYGLFIFIPAMIGVANIGGFGQIFSIAMPLVTILIAVYAFYIIRSIVLGRK